MQKIFVYRDSIAVLKNCPKSLHGPKSPRFIRYIAKSQIDTEQKQKQTTNKTKRKA